MIFRYHGPSCHGNCEEPACACDWINFETIESNHPPVDFLLASGSHYRAELLRRFKRPFKQYSPNVDESPTDAESPQDLATRLAQLKADSRSSQADQANTLGTSIIIASDQVAAVNGRLLGKPGTVENAEAQLSAMQNKTVCFYTALHMRNRQTGNSYSSLDVTKAKLRSLSMAEISRYIAIDKPLDCAGSFKVESLGVSLFERIESLDPTALVGLPMIAVSKGLRSFGINVP